MEKRIGWMVASTVVIAALQRAQADDQQPLFLVKGGLYLELQLGVKARTTKDVDTLFRGTAKEFEDAVDQVLVEPWGPFTLQRTRLERVVKAPRLIKPYRFDVTLVVRGKTWRRVQVEVSFPEGGICSQTVPLPAPPVSYFGLDTPDQIVAIAMDYQVAQKMHAASDPDIPPDIINDRVRDIVDLVLIKRHFYRDDPIPASLRTACLDVFNARAEEAVAVDKPPRGWPPLFASNSAWEKAYPKLAAEVGLTLALEEAIAFVQEWVAQIDQAA
ncbi:MAG: nucleotidyl transferase AbiEii/AbiGii toxin family protein [Propionibacteriaceae bacterium]|nr:nucleotidyl transferase AbiEii/AbiGii toxin family protein [Propionibacteriaceae bacterium]